MAGTITVTNQTVHENVKKKTVKIANKFNKQPNNKSNITLKAKTHSILH